MMMMMMNTTLFLYIIKHIISHQFFPSLGLPNLFREDRRLLVGFVGSSRDNYRLLCVRTCEKRSPWSSASFALWRVGDSRSTSSSFPRLPTWVCIHRRFDAEKNYHHGWLLTTETFGTKPTLLSCTFLFRRTLPGWVFGIPNPPKDSEILTQQTSQHAS